MLRLQALPKVLEQATGNGVLGAFIVNREGSLLSSVDINPEESSRPTLVAAIIANLWEVYSEEATRKPQFMLLQCQHGNLGVKAVASNLIVCVYGENSVPAGLLKLKVEALVAHLTEPLSKVNIE